MVTVDTVRSVVNDETAIEVEAGDLPPDSGGLIVLEEGPDIVVDILTRHSRRTMRERKFITGLAGRPMRLDIGRSIPFRSSSFFAPFPGGYTVIGDEISFAWAGSDLYVTIRPAGGGLVDVTVSTVRSEEAGGAFPAPSIRSHSAMSTVRVSLGTTILLASSDHITDSSRSTEGAEASYRPSGRILVGRSGGGEKIAMAIMLTVNEAVLMDPAGADRMIDEILGR